MSESIEVIRSEIFSVSFITSNIQPREYAVRLRIPG